MKFIYLVILGIVIVESRYSFSFLLDSKDLYNTTLRFQINQAVTQLSLRCDNLTYDAWRSYSQDYVEVSSEQRRSYECSDTNYTLTVSYDYNQDFIKIRVVDAYFFREIGTFNFLSDNTYPNQLYLNENQAYLQSLYSSKNDFKVPLYYSQQLYMEVIKCSNSQGELLVQGYDKNYQYHNVSKSTYYNVFYDVVTNIQGYYNYRLTKDYSYSPDVFIKYQTGYNIDLNIIKDYGNKNYYVNAYESNGQIVLSVPTVNTKYGEVVVFQIVVSSENYEGDNLACIQGDINLFSNYGNYYNSLIQTVPQNINYGYQSIEVNFPNQSPGWYNVRITAQVNHTGIIQSIQYDRASIYQSYARFPDSQLVHILAPIIIFCISIIGLIVGACKYSAKKKKLQQQQLLQQYQNNMNQNYQI